VDATGQLWTGQQKIGTMPAGQQTPAPDICRNAETPQIGATYGLLPW
jgi:hypothetical protein